jgi:fibronectin type 3 domain-containing protein
MEHLFSSRNKKRGKMISPFFPLCLTLLLVFSTFLLPPLGQSAQVSLAWDNSTDPTVASYKIYTGTSSGSYSQNTNVGFANPYTVTNLTEGKTYYFAATALGSNGLESGYSNQVSYTVPLAQTIYTITAVTV